MKSSRDAFVVVVLVVLVLVLLIPVVVLYWLFGDKNYFGLDGFWKGLVATGPIAAYCFLVWLCQGFVLKLRRDQLLPESETRSLETDGSPDVHGNWQGEWQWMDPVTNQPRMFVEQWTIKQQGRTITGVVNDGEGLDAQFRGEIYSRQVVLYYVSTKSNRLSCGSLALQLNGDASAMAGDQVYYDLESNQLEQSEYRLRKAPANVS